MQLYDVVLEVAQSRGMQHLGRLPGCAEVELGEGWEVVVNPHEQPADHPRAQGIPPRTMVALYQSFPVGVLTQDSAIFLGEVRDELSATLRRVLLAARAPLPHGGLNG